MKMKTGSIPVYSRRSSSSTTASHSLERNAHFSVNQPSLPNSGLSKPRDRSLPRSVTMAAKSCEKLNATLPSHLPSDECFANQNHVPCALVKSQTPKSEHKSKIARPKTSMNKSKKDVLEMTSKLPVHSFGGSSKQHDSSSRIPFPVSRTPTHSLTGKENCDSASKLKVEALNDKNVLVSTLERNNSNSSINSCGFKSRLVKPSAACANGKQSGIAKPRTTSRLSRPSSPDSVDNSLEDVLGQRSSKSAIREGAKKRFGSTEGILSSNKESKTLNAMKALMTDMENNFKNRDDEKKSWKYEEEKAACEINKNEKQEKLHNKTSAAEGKTLLSDNKSSFSAPSRKHEATCGSKMPRLASHIPKSRLPSLHSALNKTPHLSSFEGADHSKSNVSIEHLENEVFHKPKAAETSSQYKTDETRSISGDKSINSSNYESEANCTDNNNRMAGDQLSAFDIKPMPLVMSSPYFHLSNLSSAIQQTPHDPKLFLAGLDNQQPNGYKLFETAGAKSKNSLTASFEQEYGDTEIGYMSDGDVLSSRRAQASSGYTSDGGTSFHSGLKTLPSKMKESDDNYETICDENFDGCSSLSSGEDTNSLSSFTNGKLIKGLPKMNRTEYDIENFERVSRIRSTMPAKGRRAILPLAGFVKKNQEQTANNAQSDLEEAEIDIKVTYENKLNKLKKSSLQIPSDSIINEGMIELDEVLNDSNVQQKSLLSEASHFSEPKDFKSGLSSHPSNFSLLSQYSLGDAKSIYGNRKDGVSGSKFGMSLEQCYNSGVFRRRNKSINTNADDNGSITESGERSQIFGKTLSVASDGDQGLPFGGRLISPSKVNPYATMSRSHVASRTSERALHASKAVVGEANGPGDHVTPLVSRRSETSMCPSEDSASVASFPCFKLRLHNQLPPFKNLSTSSPAPSHVVEGNHGDRKLCSPSGYVLSRSGSHHAPGFNSSRPPSTNGNGSTLSLGSCSSLYSTAEEYHAQEIRRLRHELETAHSRVASLNMQLNINESVVQAFERSISNLNHRLQQLSLFTPEKDPDARDLKSSLEQFSSFDKTSMNFNQSSIPEDCTSLASINQHQELEKKKRQKKWLMSFGKAFFRKKNKMSNLENNLVLETGSSEENQNSNLTKEQGHDPISMLEQKLHEKEMKLTDVQLEALSSAHQLDQLRDSMAQMEKEMVYLRMDNNRLKQLMTQKNPTEAPRTNSPESAPVSPAKDSNSNAPLTTPETPGKNAKNRKITLSVQMTHANHSGQLSEIKSTEIMFGKLYLTENMGWETLNRAVSKKFQNYLNGVDPVDGLGLDPSSIRTLHIGDLTWQVDGPPPSAGPSSYLVGFSKSVSLSLRGVEEDRLDSLAFETMIPRPILERYVSLMVEFRRVIFCGPSGTGKTYLALKLAQYMSDRLAKDQVAPTMSVFNVDHKSSKELRQYLSNISSNSSPQNNVIVLDNLHHVVSLADVFNGFITIGNQNSSPYVIGTMNQVSSSATNLQLHHMFRWVLYSNHIKPVCGFLGRFLRRQLAEREVLGCGGRTVEGELDVDGEEELRKTIDWIPKVWQHVNRLLEMHNSSEVTLGPQLYLSCPMGGSLMRVWFTDLWNYSIFPYLMEAIKDGIQTYGCRAAWEDPTEWVEKTCPWAKEKSQLLHLRPEDVGYDTQQQSSENSHPFHASNAGNNNNNNNNLDPMIQQTSCKVSSDPLLNMLLRLQEFSSNSKDNVVTTNRECL